MAQTALSKQIGFQNNHRISAEVFQAVRQRVAEEADVQGGVETKSIQMRGVKVFEGHKEHLGFIALAAFFVSAPTDGDGRAENRAKVLQKILDSYLKTERKIEDHQLAAVLGFAALCEAEYPKTDAAKDEILEHFLNAYTLHKATPPADDADWMRRDQSSETTGSSASVASFSDNGSIISPDEAALMRAADRGPDSPPPNKKRPEGQSLGSVDDQKGDAASYEGQVGLSFSLDDAPDTPSQTPAISLIKRLFGHTISSQAFFDTMPKDIFPAKKIAPDAVDMPIDESPSIDLYRTLIAEVFDMFDKVFQELEEERR